jgi:hypothetical protein
MIAHWARIRKRVVAERKRVDTLQQKVDSAWKGTNFPLE